MSALRVAAVVIALSAAPAAWAAGGGPVLTVAVVEAGLRRGPTAVVGHGDVVPWQEISVSPEASGLRVSEVRVEEGQRVAAGEVLAVLDDTLLRTQVTQAMASLSEAEANSDLARADLRRAQELASRDVGSRQALDQRVASARAAEARVASARGRLDELDVRLAQTRVLAPDAGVVSRRSVLPGATAVAGQEAFRILRQGRLEVEARVTEMSLGTVAAGQRATVIAGDGSTGEGTVRLVAPTVDAATRLGRVLVSLPGDTRLRPGMSARVEIEAGSASGVVVPVRALTFRDGAARVAVVGPDGRIDLRTVTVGAIRGGEAEVTSGLGTGERVVSSGAGFLAGGDLVRIAGGAR